MQLIKMMIQPHSRSARIKLGPLAANATGMAAGAFGQDALLCEDFTPHLTRHSRILAALAAAGSLP